MAIVNFFGTNWDSEAGLGTKIGYVASALNRGVLPSQIKNWIASVDPANAVQEVYDLLGIPESDPQPAYQEPVYQEPAYVEPEPWWVTQQREEEQRVAREQAEARQARVNEILGIQGLSAEQKGRFYLDQLAQGYSDASLRQEVESILGYQSAWPQLQEIARNLQQQDQETARQAEQQRVQGLTNERQNLFREIYGREGSPDEIQAVLDMPVDQVRSTLQKSYTDWLKTQQPASSSAASQLQETETQIGTRPRESVASSAGNFGEDAAIALLPGLGEGLFDDQGNRHTSTFVKTYKVINGEMVETPFTPQDVGSNDFVFYIGSKTGGADRERAAQSYRLQDGQLVPVGEPSYYKGAQDIGFFEGMLREGLPFIASVVPGLNVAIGTALGATSTVMAQALGNAVMNAALSVAAGAKPADALKNAAASFGVSQLVPNLTGNQFIDNAIKAGATAQLTGGKVGDAIASSLIQTGAQAASQGLSITGDRAIDSGLVSAATSALQAQVTGADSGLSALQGFVNGANASLNQKQTPEIPGTSTTIGGGAATDTTAPSATTGGLGTTPDVGMDTAAGATQDDVLGIVAQEQAANQAQTVNQAMQGAQKITAAEAAARELYPLTERYQGPNGTIYLRDINTGKITQLLPTGEASTIAGGGVFLDQPNVIGAVEALPANAVYQGILYAGDPKLIGKQLTANDLASLSISTERDTNVLPVGNLVVTQNADGTITQRDKATGDTATIDASGNIVSQTKSVYTRANEVAGGLTGTAQAGLGELGAAISATAQQLGVDSQGAIDRFKAIQTSGELMRPEVVNQQSQAFVDEIYRVASNPNSTTEQIARAIASATLNNPAGAAAILGSELIQELPALLLPGGKVAQFLGSMALNAAESAGAQALQKIDELKVTNPNATPQELARMARQDAGVAGAVTAAIGLIPGVNNVLARTLIEPFLEGLEEGSIEYITTGDANAAKGKAVLGAVIGGKTATAINTGEELATAAQNNLGVQVPGGVAAPAGASLTVTGTTLPTDTTVNPEVDLTPDNLGTLPTTGVDIPTFDVAPDTTNMAVVVAVDENNNQASVIDNTGALTIVPANGLTPGQTTVLPTAPTITVPTVPAVTETSPAVTTTPTVTTTPVVTTPAVTDTSGLAATTPTETTGGATTNVTTGVVLQDNGNGTSLVLTQDGGATNVPSVDTTGTVLTPGTSVTVDTTNNTATSTTTATDTATQTGTQTQTGAQTTTDTATQVQPETVTQNQPETQTQTQPETVTQTQPETVTQVTPQPEVTTQPEVTPEPTPQINTEEPEPTQPEDLISPPVTELTPEDQLLQQIIKELEKPTVPDSPPPPPIEPPPFTPPESVVETPPVTVEQTLTVKPRTAPTVPPGSRVQESAQILPIRPGLSEGYLGDIEGTPEEKQEPVWNVRSLKLRRLLGI